MTRKIVRSLVVACAGTALLLSACGGSSKNAANSGDDATPQRGGTITIGLVADAVGGLDPHKTPNQQSTWVDGLVYSRLVGLDANGQVQPDLAESYTEDSPTSYTFRLRKGVKFHNGRELTAADVKYSLDRVRGEETGSAKGYWFVKVKSVDVVDDHTVGVQLTEPDAALLTHLANPIAAIVPKEVVDEKGDLNQTMVGSGPFKFVSHTPGVEIVLERNADYYVSGQPYLDKVVLKPLEDENTRVNALKSGDLDVATFLPVNIIDQLKSEPNLTITSGRSGQQYGFMMQVDQAPFNNLKVRQAIFNAIDRKALVQGAIFGKGTALTAGPIPSWHPYALKEEIYASADMTKAKQLMAESGVSTPVKVTAGLWSGQTFAVNAMQVIQQELKPLGIEIEIKQYGDYASYNKAVFVDKVHQVTIQGIGGKIDPNDWLADVFRTGSKSNLTGYSDPEVDKLLDAGAQTTDEAERRKNYDAAQKLIAETGPTALLWNMEQPDAVTAKVHNYQHRTDLQLDGLLTTWVTSS